MADIDNALELWRSEGKAPSGVCPHCGSTVSVVARDERYVARCSHRGCGARGPQHSRLASAVEAFCRPPACDLNTLARNLRDAAGCALAYDLGCSAEYARTPWDANLAGQPAPGWER